MSYGASKDLILIHTVQLKSMTKAHSSGIMVSSGISAVVIASVYSEKTHLKKLMMMRITMTMMTMMMMMMMMMMMNKSQETMVFSGCQKQTSTMKLMPEKLS